MERLDKTPLLLRSRLEAWFGKRKTYAFRLTYEKSGLVCQPEFQVLTWEHLAFLLPPPQIVNCRQLQAAMTS